MKQVNILSVSIPHRYSTTTVFTAFLLILYHLFYLFQPFSIKKAGRRPSFLISPQTLDFTGFFYFLSTKKTSRISRCLLEYNKDLLTNYRSAVVLSACHHCQGTATGIDVFWRNP